MIRQRKVLYVGISDAPAWWIAQANILAQLRGWSPFVGLQIEYSLIERSVERELVPMAKALRTGRIVTAVKAVSDQTGRGMAEVALAWLRYRPVPVIPIIGARKLSQLQDNLASFNVALSAEQVKALDEASQIDPGFPYHLYAKESVRAIAFGGMRDQILA